MDSNPPPLSLLFSALREFMPVSPAVRGVLFVKVTKRTRRISSSTLKRPKKKTIAQEILSELNTEVLINEKGSSYEVTKLSAICKMLIGKSLSGDLNAVKVLLRLLPPDKNEIEKSYPKFILNLGHPHINKKIRLEEIEKERIKLLSELETLKENL